MDLDRSGLEVLDRAACLRLLAEASVGRIAVTSGALPMVFPVAFTLCGDQIVFRTMRGTTLDGATHDTVVAFESDVIDPAFRQGWSVVVTGVARELRDHAEVAVRRSLPGVWAQDGDGRLVAVSTEMMSGRRMIAPDGPVAG